VAGVTTSVLALSIIQPLHGFTFALLHLASMRMMRTLVPARLAGTKLPRALLNFMKRSLP
jgi:PPP family 3-phenylpropionic acid transporter